MYSIFDLREEIGDIKTLGNEGEQSLESFAFLWVESAVEKRGNADVFGIVVEVSVGADSKYHRRCFAQRVCRCTELREHFPVSDFEIYRERESDGEDCVLVSGERRRRSRWWSEMASTNKGLFGMPGLYFRIKERGQKLNFMIKIKRN